MLSKYSLGLIVPTVLLFGLFLLSSPQTASAGLAPGCCITNGGQCSPSCGPIGSSCQNDGTSITQCNGTINPGDDICGGPNKERVNCYIEGDFCTQIANNRGVCGDAPPPTPTPDPSITPTPPAPVCTTNDDCDDLELCTIDTCVDESFCTSVFDESIAPECEQSSVIIPTMGQWGMLLATIVLGIFAVISMRSKKDSELS
ncbi:MAG TPA: hypothetical protein VLB82_09600 [Thermodesulfobacteriota bacterium]|nr:hypothetical protein [Thermodesulfobacteriota bacterium]